MRSSWSLTLLAVLANGAHAEPLTLAAAFAEAHASSPNVAAQALQIDAARSAVLPSGALPDPKASLSVTDFPIPGHWQAGPVSTTSVCCRSKSPRRCRAAPSAAPGSSRPRRTSVSPTGASRPSSARRKWAPARRGCAFLLQRNHQGHNPTDVAERGLLRLRRAPPGSPVGGRSAPVYNARRFLIDDAIGDCVVIPWAASPNSGGDFDGFSHIFCRKSDRRPVQSATFIWIVEQMKAENTHHDTVDRRETAAAIANILKLSDQPESSGHRRTPIRPVMASSSYLR